MLTVVLASFIGAAPVVCVTAASAENLEGISRSVERNKSQSASVKPLVAEELPLLAIRAAAAVQREAGTNRASLSTENAATESAAGSQRQAEPAVSDAPKPAANGTDGASPSFASEVAARFHQAGENLFKLTQISVTGNYRISDEEVLRRAELQQHPWIWDCSLDEVQRKVRENPWVEDVRIRRSFFPLEIQVEIIEAEPWLIAEYDQRSWIVSRSGNLIQTLAALTDSDLILETTELPRLDGLAPERSVTNVLSSGNARFLFAVRSIKLLHAAGELPFSVSRYSLLPSGGIEVFPADDATLPRVILSSQTLQEAEDSLQRLRLVLADLQKRGEHPRRIDLRFANQVVVQ